MRTSSRKVTRSGGTGNQLLLQYRPVVEEFQRFPHEWRVEETFLHDYPKCVEGQGMFG